MNVSLVRADELLQRVAAALPKNLRQRVTIVGSIAAASAFRGLTAENLTATKDVDLVFHPHVSAVSNAAKLAARLMEKGWTAHYPPGLAAGSVDDAPHDLPALRLRPPAKDATWFVELIGDPPDGQAARKHWRRIEIEGRYFALPSFRYMRVAVHGAELAEQGLRVASPSRMALAHLLEHAEPDRTQISGLRGNPPRFTKDVGRAISLWWLAREASVEAEREWLDQWVGTIEALLGGDATSVGTTAARGLAAVSAVLPLTHEIALRSVLAPYGVTLESFRRTHRSLGELLQRLQAM